MQHVESLPLSQWRDCRNLSGRDAASFALKLARAISYAHSRGIAHGNLQPSNVIVTENGEPFLTDFGCVDGTPESDLQDLGAVFFFLLTGREHRSAPYAIAALDPALAAISRP